MLINFGGSWKLRASPVRGCWHMRRRSQTNRGAPPCLSSRPSNQFHVSLSPERIRYTAIHDPGKWARPGDSFTFDNLQAS